MKKIGIVGLGLIGGSMAKGLLTPLPSGSRYEVWGYDPDHVTTGQAATFGVNIADSYVDLASVVDLVFFATPLEYMDKEIRHFISKCDREIVITDVGSVKKPFAELSEQFSNRGEIRWIGGHPMAGTQHSGFSFSEGNLFQGAVWALAISHNTRLKDYLDVARIAFDLGARVIPVDPGEHDDAVARISHFPYVASALVAILAGESNCPELALNLAAGSFRDLTRVAGSSARFSRGLVFSNKAILAGLIADGVAKLRGFHNSLVQGDTDQLDAYFSRGRAVRLDFLRGKRVSLRMEVGTDLWNGARDKLLELGRNGGVITSQEFLDNDKLSVTFEILESLADSRKEHR
jgi:prephenate dehydrogenase